MSEANALVMLRNKSIQVGDTGYRLTIKKERLIYTKEMGYVAYLSAENSASHTKITFPSLNNLRNELEKRIAECHKYRNSEGYLFEELRVWDGVVRV